MAYCENRVFYVSNFHDNEYIPPQGVRTVLHCDGNAFFASCEAMVNPEYKKVPFAVCGSSEERHGIVLAKNDLAKKYGVTTGETVWKAKQKCPGLVTVRPTYGLYTEVSERMNRIFYDFTDRVEPFGIDESWLDVTGSSKLFGDGRAIADRIRQRVRDEIGVTVSVGVSFNKAFAKLGSDMKKPDATSVIPFDRFEAVVWPLPVTDLLFVGRSTGEKLFKAGIRTIGDLALADEGFIKSYLGKNGLMLRDFALGRDHSEVAVMGYEPEPKSVSNGMTFRRNLATGADISFAVNYLSDPIAAKLRRHGLFCSTVAVSLRRTDLSVISRRVTLDTPTCISRDIAQAALALIYGNHPRGEEIYSVTVQAGSLCRDRNNVMQQSMFPTERSIDFQKGFALGSAVDRIRERYGKNSVRIASAVGNALI